MARLLKQSTVIIFRIGPFLDSTDAVTAEVALTIAQADIQISKVGGAFAQTSDAAPTTTHDADGWYQCPLTTTDTNTLGMLTVQIVMAGALPVWEHFMVVTANVWDSFCSTDVLDASVTQIGGVAQSATDLKHFADSGYDPATSKVTGVVLADTLTTYTGNTVQTGDTFARLGAPVAASISADIAVVDGVADAILVDTAVIGAAGAGLTDLGGMSTTMKAQVNTEVDGALNTAIPGTPTADSINQRVVAIDDLTQASGTGDLAAVLVDTANMQPKLGTPAGTDMSADIAAVKVDTAAVLADTGTDGVLVATAAQNSISDVVWDEAIAGHAGAGSTGAALSAASAPSAATVADAVWDEATAGHATAGSTGLALSNASAPTAGTVADAVWDEALSGHATAGSAGAALTTASTSVPGTGADTVTLTITTSGGTAIADADVWITSDAAGATVVAGTKQTNSAGQVTFQLDAGTTYYRWCQKDGYTFTNPSSFVASAD